ncbi:MAG: aminotransferase class IV [Acidimicrobiales bacterium]
MSTDHFTAVIIDGVVVDAATASIPVTDIGFIRGFGVFEVIRGFDGRCFRLDHHLERLGRSAAMLGIDLPAAEDIGDWATTVAAAEPEALVRLLVSAGDDPFEGTTRVVVTCEPAPEQADELTLLPVVAPWHSDGAQWELLGAKTLSYGNNFGAIRQAKLAGFSDALLIGRSGAMLEGPTFTVGWVVEETGTTIYETPAMSLGILDSITRRVALDAATEAGLHVRQVRAPLERLDRAVEFFALSTLRDTISVTRVGDREFAPGQATLALREAMLALKHRELGAGSVA